MLSPVLNLLQEVVFLERVLEHEISLGFFEFLTSSLSSFGFGQNWFC